VLLLGDVLRRHAAYRGNKLAYVIGETRVTYREMNRRTNQLAHLWQAAGVRRGDRVAILAGNVPLYPEAYFAAAKLGAILVPVNARYKESEVEYVLVQSAARMLLLTSEFAPLIGDLRPRLPGVERFLTIDERLSFADHIPDLLRDAAESEPNAFVDEQDPHVMLYTSGTTGAAKGVLSSHRSYLLAAAQSQNGLRLGEEDVGVSMFPMFHMGGWALPLGLWWSGATAVILPKADPQACLRAIERERATYFYGIPTLFHWMLDLPEFARFNVSSLRLVASGTSAMSESQVHAIERGFPGAAMVIIYGSTEAGPVTMLRPPDVARKPTSVGLPALNVDVRIVDVTGNDVPDGTAGEILCRSDFLMLGYWNMPQATQEALLGGWYHTGDLAVRDEEGFVYIAGRAKDMIKTGGENVFPAEVEAVLCEHPAIREAAVFALSDPVWGESVAAAVVCEPGARLTGEEVILHVKGRLAAYKKPKQVFFVAELPKTAATGRVQKTLLREAAATGSLGDGSWRDRPRPASDGGD
jgi:acyl-CoA synthetase (AMP-forming)/AMP-acid ligase II